MVSLSRRLLSSVAGALTKQIDFYSEFHPSPLSIQQIVDFGRDGNQTASYLFLRKELLVRLANIMKEINLLPHNLLEMPSVRQVRDWYVQSFSELVKFSHHEPKESVLLDFTQNLSTILNRHSTVVETMAEGIIEMRERYGIDAAADHSLQYFLDRFYLNRISVRMLIYQHTLLFGTSLPDSPRHIGCIDPKCNVVSLVTDAYENARFLCERYYLASPNLKIESINCDDKDTPISVVYVPSHLYHIVFELIKNSMRAVVEHAGPDSDELPEVQVTVVKGKEDLSIKISDRGGGFPRKTGELLFNYLYTTAPAPARDQSQAPLAGYGYGLPLSRLYARYFQGDLFLVSMEGYGTDAMIYLKALSSEANELLPVYSTSTHKRYTTAPQKGDWSHPIRHHRLFSTLVASPYFVS